MPHYKTSCLVCTVLLVGLMPGHSPRTLAQATSADEAERQLAFKLLEADKFAEEQEKFEKLAAANLATFQNDFPNEKAYRHSLKEEAMALWIVAERVANDVKAGKLKFVNDPSLAMLLKLNQANLIEAYVLFARADDGIAQDYEAYRRANRDALRRY